MVCIFHNVGEGKVNNFSQKQDWRKLLQIHLLRSPPTRTFVLSKIVLSPPFFCKSPIRATKGALKIKTLVECSPFSCLFSVNTNSKLFYRIYAESRNPAFILCRLTFNMLISKYFNLQSLITRMKCKKILVKATLDEYLWIETQRFTC